MLSAYEWAAIGGESRLTTRSTFVSSILKPAFENGTGLEFVKDENGTWRNGVVVKGWHVYGVALRQPVRTDPAPVKRTIRPWLDERGSRDTRSDAQLARGARQDGVGPTVGVAVAGRDGGPQCAHRYMRLTCRGVTVTSNT